ncbi:hypothetical protein R1sor_007038 [Riccia sorocarpa]|uniref:FCP1 homology domain-containing protein n=1 Tax=Riccia sorocarpa TaxID=122646 RepID=A0ABD3HST5_9MARC
MDTFVAVPLTRIFIHLGIITGEECDAPPAAPAAPADPSEGSAAWRSLVVRPGDCLVALLELLQKRCHIIVWSRASLKYVTAFLGLMVSKGYLPAFMLDPQVCTLWGGDGVETVHPRRNLEDSAKLKSFRRLYDHGICLRDVLLVDTSPERNSLNDPYSAVHPKAVEVSLSGRVLSVVIEVYGLASDVEVLPRRLRLRGRLLLRRRVMLRRLRWRRRLVLRRRLRRLRFEEAARVEEAAPVQEARVEEAPVEGAAPVKEPTRVEEAPAEGLTLV